MASIEEKVEEHFKALLDDLEIRHFGKTEEINSSITKALKEADSKSGGSGVNYPDNSASAAKQDPTGHSRDD